MQVEEKFKLKKMFVEIIGTIIGAALMAVGTSLFLLPNQLSSGGFSGIATILYYLLNIPMGTTIIILNIPLFMLSIYKLREKFFCKNISRNS